MHAAHIAADVNAAGMKGKSGFPSLLCSRAPVQQCTVCGSDDLLFHKHQDGCPKDGLQQFDLHRAHDQPHEW